MRTQESLLKLYSIGIVAENKGRDTDWIKVVPIEIIPMVDGELDGTVTNASITGKDNIGVGYAAQVDASVTISARWFPEGNSNRITSPDVRKGEKVKIYRYGNTDDYRWTPINNDYNLRKLETVTYLFSGTKEENVESNLDNSYYFQVSTHDKIVRLHTSNSNGEPFQYDIEINTGTGKLVITDDVGNYIAINSKQSQIEFKNKDNTKILLDKKDIKLKASGTIDVDGSGTININSKNNMEVTSDSHIGIAATDGVGLGGLETLTTPDAVIFSGRKIIFKQKVTFEEEAVFNKTIIAPNI